MKVVLDKRLTREEKREMDRLKKMKKIRRSKE